MAILYESFTFKSGCKATSNRAHLQSGHTPLLKTYAHLLDPAADPAGSLCKEEPQTVEPWQQSFPNLEALRLKYLQ